MELQATLANAFTGSGVRAHQNRLAIQFGDRVQGYAEHCQPVRRINILLPVRTDEEVASFLEPEFLHRRRGINAASVMAQDLEHWAAGLDNSGRGYAFGNQVVARDRRIREIDICGMIDDPPIDLL